MQHVNNLGSGTGRQEPELCGGIRIGVPERTGDRVVPCGFGTTAPRCHRRAVLVSLPVGLRQLPAQALVPRRRQLPAHAHCGGTKVHLDTRLALPVPSEDEQGQPCERKRNRWSFL